MATSPPQDDSARTPDPAEVAALCAEITQRLVRLQTLAQRRMLEGRPPPLAPLGLTRAFADLSARLLADPVSLWRAQMQLAADGFALWRNAVLRFSGSPAEPVVQPAPGDKRFRDEAWQTHWLFDFVKQAYLMAARHVLDAVARVEGLDGPMRRKVDFFTRQYVDALSPTNFALTNPEVLRETVASGGLNLLRGFNNLLADLERGDGELRIRMTDTGAFELGRDVATTPGKVVYRNRLMELIQYAPATETVLRRPLLIVPPWINKYYILDLREKNSYIRWCVQQGHTVFVISWVNPDASLAGLGFEDYLKEGVLEALDAIERQTGERQVNAVGYCLGGTLLAIALAWLAARRSKRVAAATFLTTLTDFSEPGELGVFIDEEQVAALERTMGERGYLEGSEMAATFNLLRANDLIWSFVINNYLLGRDPFPFDLLYWNSDSTRLPARMHGYYLRNMYLCNRLVEPGGLKIGGARIDLGRIRVPAYFISTAEDHIAPWKTTYAGARRFGGPVRFVLGGSGHIAGIVNPPAANKYGYWTGPEAALPEDPDDWFAAATAHSGSWWNDWQAWLEALDARRVPARDPSGGPLEPLDDAPGRYVRERLDVPRRAAA